MRSTRADQVVGVLVFCVASWTLLGGCASKSRVVKLTFFDPDGKPARGVVVQVESGSIRTLYASPDTTDANGVVELDSLSTTDEVQVSFNYRAGDVQQERFGFDPDVKGAQVRLSENPVIETRHGDGSVDISPITRKQ